MNRLPRVTKKHKCPICSGSDWCGFTDDGKMAICMRVWSEKKAKNGGFIHFLDGSQKIVSMRGVKNSKRVEKPRKNISDLHEIYSTFLAKLKLNDSHREQLRARGFNNIEIERIGFKTMPSKFESKNICRKLKKDGFLLENVPGFFTPHDETLFVDYYGATGYLIPIRNADGKICALTLRRDDGRSPKYLIISSGDLEKGANSGAPPHFAGVSDQRDLRSVRRIIVTEGAIKAEIIYKYSAIVTIGLVSVTTFTDSFSADLKKVFPNLSECGVAFDMDWMTKEPVRHQRERLIETLKKGSLDATGLTWDKSFKGFDDFLFANNHKLRKFAA